MEMSERTFNSAYQKLLIKREAERLRRQWDREHPGETTLEDLFEMMAIKGRMGIFQSFDPKEFGADYDIVPVPRDGTDEAEFWFGERHPETDM